MMRLRSIRLRAGRSEQAFTLVETMVAILVLSTGVGATLASMASSKRATLNSARAEVATRLASGALEDMRAQDYDSLGMAGSLSGQPLPDSARFDSPTNPTQLKIKEGGSVTTEPIYVAPTGPDDPVPGVSPVYKDVCAEGTPPCPASVSVRIWRYVTWHAETCAQGDDQVCPGAMDTKRLVVAAQVGATVTGSKPKNVVWLSSIAIDPNKGMPGGLPSTASSSLPTQHFYLHDTPCSSNTRVAPSSAHITRNTAQRSSTAAATSYCWNNATDASGRKLQPDLMSPELPCAPGCGVVADPPLYRYSDEVKLNQPPNTWGFGGGGNVIKRSTGCGQPAATPPAAPVTSYAPGDANLGPQQLHEWSTRPMPRNFELSGRVAFDFYTSTFANIQSRGKICLTLLERREVNGQQVNDEVFGSFTCEQNYFWPRGYLSSTGTLDSQQGKHLTGRRTCRNNLATSRVVDQGSRLVFVLSVAQNWCVGTGSNATCDPLASDLVFYYDHGNYPSDLRVSTPQEL